MRPLLGAFLLFALAACDSFSTRPNGRVVVVDHSGTPVEGALVQPVPQDVADANQIASQAKFEAENWTTNAQGMIHADLEGFYWDSDSCYHFHVHRVGYEDFDIAISKELMPAVYRIELKDRAPAPR